MFALICCFKPEGIEKTRRQILTIRVLGIGIGYRKNGATQ